MKVGITGANGFIGFHLRSYLATRSDVAEVRLAGRDVFASESALQTFVNGLDLIVHLAGVNRAEPDELIRGNIEPARQLVVALEKTSTIPYIAYTSSIQAVTGDTPYSEGKAGVSDVFRGWANSSGGRFANVILPHVFGEYGRPNYNSAVATFAHQIASGGEPTIHNDGQLELVHVQNVVRQIVSLYESRTVGDVRIEGRPTGVVEVAGYLKGYYQNYVVDGVFPDLSDDFDKDLFNTFRGAMSIDARCRTVTKHADNRGWLVETVKARSGGQCFVSTTHPGITRGNHFHLRKVERFMVLQGKAQIKLRKLFTNDIITYEMDGASPSYVDIPTMHTHLITNVGDTELITLFWADEFFDPETPDTTFEEVCL